MRLLIHKSSALLLMAVGLVPACDPARGGDFHDDVPDPVKLNGYAGDEYTLGGGYYRGRDVRRWFTSTRYSNQFLSTDNGAAYSTQFSPWGYLGVEDRQEILEYGSMVSGVTELRTWQGVSGYVYVTSPNGGQIQPLGPWGPTLSLSAGYHVLHRSCSLDDANQFTEVSLNTALDYDAEAASALAKGLDPFLAHCGITVPVETEFGDKVATVPLSTGNHSQPIADMAWAPDSSLLYLVGGDPSSAVANTAVWALDISSLGLQQIMAGNFYGPLQVATGGSSLILNRVTIVENYSAPGMNGFAYEIVRQPIVGPLSLPLRVAAGNATTLGWSPSWTLSQDGQTVASNDTPYDPTGIVLTDLVSGMTKFIPLPNVFPAAWNPTGKNLLLSNSMNATPSVLSLDGTVTPLPAGPGVRTQGFFPGDSAQTVPFWSTSGPRLAVQSAGGTSVYDYTTQAYVELVEASRVARPGASLKAVVATDQVFAWAIQCWGLGETSCVAELRRLTVASGKIDVVARANDALQFAVAPDGTKIVFAKGTDLYLETIAP